MIDRREFVSSLLGLGALSTFGGVSSSASAHENRKFGVQLYTLRTIFQADPIATLQAVADIGFTEVEFGGGGYDAMDASMLREALDRFDLVAPSAHIGYDALLNNLDASIAMVRTLGADTVVLPIMADQYRNEASWNEALHTINRIAAEVQAAGLGFAYHNHDFEFTVRPGGVSLFDRLLRETDPSSVGIELDLYWATYAGEDVAGLIDSLAGRLYAFHVKDMLADRGMAAVGAGTIDFANLLNRPASAAVRHLYVENDRAPTPYLPDITASLATLRSLGL